MDTTRKREKDDQRFTAKSARLAAELQKCVDDDIFRDDKLDFVASLCKQFEERSFLTSRQWMVGKKILKDADDYHKDKKVLETLRSRLEENMLPEGSENFVESILQWFDEKHFLTPRQREQVIHIAAKNSKEIKPPEAQGL